MKKVLLSVLLILSANMAAAESSSLSLALPQLPQNYQSDSFDAGELRCSNAIGSATTLEYGISGLINQGYNYDPNYGIMRDIGIYARIVIPLGKVAKERIDCNRLYEIELQIKMLELQKLQQELQQLRALQFE